MRPVRARLVRGGALALAALTDLSACEPLYAEPETGEVPRFREPGAAPPAAYVPGTPLRVMAWNIKYGAARVPFWFDCWGDRVQMTRDEVDAHLADLTALIREVNPDVLLTEELEVNSRRSAYVDMIERILAETDLQYAAYFGTWDSRYIPSEGLGRMNLGNAIFSRYPIVDAGHVRQADRTDQDAVTAAFYIHRTIGRAELALSDSQHAAVYVVHTEAYDNDGTKQKQLDQIFETVSAETLPFLLGGDFNELPPSAVHTEHFLDERETALCSEDFAQPPYTPEKMAPFFDAFAPAIPLERYGTTEEAQRRFFSHSVLGPDEVNDRGEAGFWNRTLDYLFAGAGADFAPDSGDVLQVAGQSVGGQPPVLVSDPLRLSDHAPVFGLWRVNP